MVSFAHSFPGFTWLMVFYFCCSKAIDTHTHTHTHTHTISNLTFFLLIASVILIIGNITGQVPQEANSEMETTVLDFIEESILAQAA